VPIYSLFVTIKYGLNILGESCDVFICAKIDSSGNLFKVTVKSFKAS